MALRTVDEQTYNRVRELYFQWKNLNTGIKQISTRGVNLPEAITEPICCYANGFLWSTGKGSEDAVDPNNHAKVQIKATSNFDRDLSTFGPRSVFDSLHFVRLNIITDTMYLYVIPVSFLAEIMVNGTQTFYDQQLEGKRPRFSIIDKYIIPNNILHYAEIAMYNGNIQRIFA